MAKPKAATPESPETTSPADLLDGAQDAQEGSNVPAVIAQKSTALATLDDLADTIEADADDDLGFGKDDVAIPILRVLQANSPQVKRQNSKYVEGAEAGFFYNNALNAAYSGIDGIFLIPIAYQQQATLWTPRDAGGAQGGGGFQGQIDIEFAKELLKTGTTRNEKKKLITTRPVESMGEMKPAGLELVFSAMYYCFQVFGLDTQTPSATPVAFPLTSTQLKKSRAWNTVMKTSRLSNRTGLGSYQPKMFGFLYKLTTVPESNALGDWMGVKITQDKPLVYFHEGHVREGFPGAAALYTQARDFATMFEDGKVTAVDTEIVEEPAASGTGGEGSVEDDKLPF